MTARTVLLVDDHAVVRAGCRQLLQGWAGFEVTEAKDGEEALSLSAKLNPHLVVLDLNLPGLSGFEVLEILKRTHPAIRILIFSMHEDPLYAAKALELGAHGFVSKNDDPAIIVEAARKVADGETYLSQPIAQKLALLTLKGEDDPLSTLTKRERDVLNLFGQGKSLSEIASALAISYKTTANTCSHIKAKLHLSTTSEMMRFAVAQSLE